MCGRYDLNETAARIASVFRSLGEVPLFEPRADLRPTDQAPIVRLRDDGQREAVLMRWGFKPPFAKDDADRINARGESVATAYRQAFRNRRCLVPASAFFEWSGDKGGKTKWRVTVRDKPLFAFAGLWDWRRDPKHPDAAPVEAFTIITTAPNDLLSDIHDRMPVIVDEKDFDGWLQTGSASLLRPAPSEAIEIAKA